MRPVRRRLALGIVVVVVIAAGVAWWLRGPGPMAFADGSTVALADYRGANPTGVPAALSQASAVERGEYLARAADCMVCHTTKGGKAFAGGLAFTLPFGTLYSTNITPDKETGIGTYSDQDFLDALHRGVRKDGARLYPASCSLSFDKNDDRLTLMRWRSRPDFASLLPVRATPPANTLVFPFNQRWAMGVWSAVFNADKRFEPNTAQSPEWNCGCQYLRRGPRPLR